MTVWEHWKQGFDAWEEKTADWMARALASAALLQPMGHLLSIAMRIESAREKAASRWWSAWGLPTRVDQEKALHALGQIQSRLIDLEDQLHEAQARRSASP